MPTRRQAFLQVFRGSNGKYRWRLRAANGKVVATAGEDFYSLRNAERAARRVHSTFLTGISGVELVRVRR